MAKLRAPSLELWLFKTDENGDILWGKFTFAGGFLPPPYMCVRETQDGNYLIVTRSLYDFTYDVDLVKLNSEGRMV